MQVRGGVGMVDDDRVGDDRVQGDGDLLGSVSGRQEENRATQVRQGGGILPGIRSLRQRLTDDLRGL